jgi:leucyl/phenylalanyl-tRNA--protein transferase
VGADLAPETLVAAYAQGYFPMPIRSGIRPRQSRIGWWFPNPRGVLPLDGLRLTRSLRRSLRRYEVTVDHDFDDVIRTCAELPRPHGWISPDIIEAYSRLARLGIAHSVEARDPDTGALVGGLYGVSLGGFFAGESMFHTAVDASKVALVHLVEILREVPDALLDVQWATPHLTSLGVVEVDRPTYLGLLDRALDAPTPSAFATVA